MVKSNKFNKRGKSNGLVKRVWRSGFKSHLVTNSKVRKKAWEFKPRTGELLVFLLEAIGFLLGIFVIEAHSCRLPLAQPY